MSYSIYFYSFFSGYHCKNREPLHICKSLFQNVACTASVTHNLSFERKKHSYFNTQKNFKNISLTDISLYFQISYSFINLSICNPLINDVHEAFLWLPTNKAQRPDKIKY